MHKVLIEGLDHFGRGLAHINKKIVFVENALPNEVVDIKITSDKKHYMEGVVNNYLHLSDKRVKSICPYFPICGGCNTQHLSYSDTLEFKKGKVQELLNKNKIIYNKEIEVIENVNYVNYRNKVSLKIIDGVLGYYEAKSHHLLEVKECLIANKEINKVIKNYKLLNIKNGNLIIRTNLNNEVLIIIDTDDSEYNIELAELKKVIKLVGIVYNNKTIYGDNFLYQRLGGYLFKVSFDAFFQVNPYICEWLFKLVEANIDNNAIVLDLYSGVGTLSIVASNKAREVISVEIIKNAVINGNFNAKLNKRDNIKFLLGDASKVIEKLKNDFDILIVDPPRIGLDKKTIDFIKSVLPKKIIYISCDANTLMRDLKLLKDNYEILDYKILDMFSYSYHLESFCVLKAKK